MSKTSIVVDGVTYYISPPDLARKARDTHDKYEWLKAEVLVMVDRAENLYNGMKDDGLKFSTIEAEGYLRAAKEIKGALENIEQSYSESSL